jgi:uncharacterized protein (DUF2062 family)
MTPVEIAQLKESFVSTVFFIPIIVLLWIAAGKLGVWMIREEQEAHHPRPLTAPWKTYRDFEQWCFGPMLLGFAVLEWIIYRSSRLESAFHSLRHHWREVHKEVEEEAKKQWDQ